MTTSSSSPTAASSTAGPGTGPLVVGVLSGLAHLVPGYFMLVSGLVAPLWAIVMMLAIWVVLAVVLVRMVRAGSWLTPLIPIIAMAIWWGTIMLGGNVLGWTA